MPSRARWYIGSVRDVVAVELDAAAVGLDQPGDHVEHRGLAGAVRPEQADRLAAPHVEARALHHLAAAEALLHRMGGEIISLLDRLLVALRRLPAVAAVGALLLAGCGVAACIPAACQSSSGCGCAYCTGCGTSRAPAAGRRFPIAPARHRRLGARDPIGAGETDQAPHRRQIDPPAAVDRRCRSSPARRGAAAPKKREQFVKHVGCPASQADSVASGP